MWQSVRYFVIRGWKQKAEWANEQGAWHEKERQGEIGQKCQTYNLHTTYRPTAAAHIDINKYFIKNENTPSSTTNNKTELKKKKVNAN